MKRLTIKLCSGCRPLAHFVASTLLWRKGSFLRNYGWFESFHHGAPTDSVGNPLPWYTYSAIRFLEDRIHKDMQVFEYGSGNSTLWWSQRASRVVACEHDRFWAERMQRWVPANVKIEKRSLDEDKYYPELIREYPAAFDVVVIDGRKRVECAVESVSGVKDNGVIIWDNSDRKAYAEGFEYLASKGFRRLDFWGPGPVNRYEWCTTVLYRATNSLGI